MLKSDRSLFSLHRNPNTSIPGLYCVVCAIGEVRPLLSGCSGPSPYAFCLTVPEGCCSSYHHISHPSGQQQGAGKKKCVCVCGWVVFLCFAGTARIASVTSILIWKTRHARQAPLNCQACWRCCLHPGSQQSAKTWVSLPKVQGGRKDTGDS